MTAIAVSPDGILVVGIVLGLLVGLVVSLAMHLTRKG